jgi:hypothetical protein
MSAKPASCPYCSAPLRPSDEACPFCGRPISEGSPGGAAAPPPPSPQTPAAAEPLSAVATPSESGTPPRPRVGSAPSPDVASVATAAPAWERWREFGFFTALWLTWRDSVFRPVAFFRHLPPRAGYGAPLGFTVLVTVVGLFFNFYWGTIEEAVSGTLQRGLLVELIVGFMTLLFGLALVIPLYLGLLFASAAIIHLGFRIVGAGRRGYEATFRAVAYASGPAAFSVFPFFGPLLALVWGMVVIFIAVREVQRTTNGRASLGFLLPFLVVLGFFLLLAVLAAVVLRSLASEPTI